MGAKHGQPQSTCSLVSMHLTRGHYARSWGDRILATCQMWKSEEPLVVYRFLTGWLIDVCGSSAILLGVHLDRITTEPLQRLSDKYSPTGSDQQEDLATLGYVQLRQTLVLWTLASRWLEKGHYSRWMATYCEHSNGPVEYAMKEECINWKGCDRLKISGGGSRFICSSLTTMLSVGMPTSGIKDRIDMEWKGKQYLLGTTCEIHNGL